MPESLRAQQLAFARHVRDPDAHPAPAGVEDRRLRVYRELFQNNIATLLGGKPTAARASSTVPAATVAPERTKRETTAKTKPEPAARKRQ